jgi:hypothetical protein
LIKYPFIPKSTARLTPGDFWSVPLADGRFACGRVLHKMPAGRQGNRVGFWGGLQNWVGTAPPTPEAIAGTGIVDAGTMHILSITTLGGAVLGHAKLADTETSACHCVACGNSVLDPFEFVRTASDEDRKTMFPCSAWGYDFIRMRAEWLFGFQ